MRLADWTRVSRRAYLACLLLSAGLLIQSAHGGTIRTDRSDELYRQLAGQSEYDSVGHFEWNEGDFSFNGSGVLIADDWVLTAGHVVGGQDNMGGGIERLRFRVGSRTHTVEEWIPHPVWTSSGGSLDDGVDLGLVRLTRPALVEPATIYEQGNERGQVGTIDGFGSTGTGATGADVSTSDKRAGNNVLDFVRSDLIEIDFDNPTFRRDSSYGTSTPLDLEYLPAQGDSGGGLFIDTPDGVQLVGITSYTAAFDAIIDSDYGDIAGFVRVASHLDWIEEIVGPLDAVLGDFDSDGRLTAEDIDFLTEQIGFPLSAANSVFDLNGDGAVTLRDRQFWVENVFETRLGDVNLDGRIDERDSEQIRESLFTLDTGWATGDVNGDGLTDGSDWNIWLSQHNEAISSAAVSVLVPEPNGELFLAMAMLSLVFVRKRS